MNTGDFLLLVLTALAAGFCRSLRIIPKISAALVAAFSTGLRRKFVISRKASLIVRNACAALAGDLTLLLGIHGCEAAF